MKDATAKVSIDQRDGLVFSPLDLAMVSTAPCVSLLISSRPRSSLWSLHAPVTNDNGSGRMGCFGRRMEVRAEDMDFLVTTIPGMVRHNAKSMTG